MIHLLLFLAIIGAIIVWHLQWWKFWVKKLTYKDEALLCTGLTTLGSIFIVILCGAVWTLTA